MDYKPPTSGELEELIKEAKVKLTSVKTIHQLNDLHAAVLGSESKLASDVRNLRLVDLAVRPATGRLLNQYKQLLKQLLSAKEAELQTAKQGDPGSKQLDLTLPCALAQQLGTLHPVTRIMLELHEIMAVHGFDYAEGPDIEKDYYNFTALNIPALHPARQMMATTYLADRSALLRTHTSPVQIRWMEKHQPPFRVYSCGRVFRNDYDQSHTPMFHQLEGLVIDKKTSMADLRAMLQVVLATLFAKKDLELRFRPSYFPFTCPSAEVDLKIGDAWLEVIGCGMVHPQVLANLKIDPEQYQGYAWGFGLDRLAMIKYQLNDLRRFFSGGSQWLKANGFNPLDYPTYAGGL